MLSGVPWPAENQELVSGEKMRNSAGCSLWLGFSPALIAGLASRM